MYRVFHALAVLGKAGVVRAFRAKPRSLASACLAQALQREGIDFRTIVDGGANVGQFARAMSTVFPQAVIHSIEPLPDVAAQLARNLQDCPRLHVHRVALGSQDGELEFHRNAYNQASSFLPLRTQLRGESLQEVQKLAVPVRRLDSLLQGEKLEPPVLLKLDLQGFELPALQGAGKLLGQCSHVLVETVFEQIYEGEPLFSDLHRFLADAGFRFVRPLNFLHDKRGSIVQMDALFVRDETARAAPAQDSVPAVSAAAEYR